MSIPPLRALQIFAAVGRSGSVSRAAVELGVSPAAVSQQIQTILICANDRNDIERL